MLQKNVLMPMTELPRILFSYLLFYVLVFLIFNRFAHSAGPGLLSCLLICPGAPCSFVKEVEEEEEEEEEEKEEQEEQ